MDSRGRDGDARKAVRVIETPYRRCAKCDVVKVVIADFAKNGKGGYTRTCKQCISIRQRTLYASGKGSSYRRFQEHKVHKRGILWVERDGVVGPQ